ncbi:MAG: hypothetical protein ACRC06_05665 [Waterburya sp.]
MLAGVAGSVIWKSGLQLSDAVYEVLPGMAAGFLVYLIFLVIKKISRPDENTPFENNSESQNISIKTPKD